MSPHTQQLLRRLRSDIISGHIRRIHDQQLVGYAQQLHIAFVEERSPNVSRNAIARMLIYIYNTLQRRLADSVTRGGIDQVALHLNDNNPLAGTLENIPVFNNLDVWISSLSEYTPPPRPRPRPHQTININEPTILVPRGNRGVPATVPIGAVTQQDAQSLFQINSNAATNTENSTVESAGQALEIVNFAAGVVEFALEVGATSAAAATIGSFLAIFGLATAIVGSIVGLIATWASADRLAEFNARCQGYWNAFGDMANQFASSDFLRLPRNQWPQLRDPVPHFPPMPQEAVEQLSTAAQAWRRGEQQGCREATQLIRRFSTTPYRWRRPNGQTLVIDDGRIFLHAMYVGFRGRVRERIQNYIDGEIRRQNDGRGWPLLR